MASPASVVDLLALQPPGWGGNLLRGALSTLQIAFVSYSIGILIGLGGAMAKLRGGRIVRVVFELYTTLVRASPELLLILLLYYAGTSALNTLLNAYGYSSVFVSGFLAAVGVLGFVQGAYSTEVIRAAILAIPFGQIEAARAFGMRPSLAFRRIILPAMLPFAIPGLANLWMIVTKETALISVVGYAELAMETRQAAGATKAYITFYVAAGAIYLVMTLGSNVVLQAIERRVRRGMPKLG
jgi:polar amino acid transport system permease protein